jgi:hypothetical protein
MAALDAIIEYGTLPAQDFPIDEPNILLDSLSIDPKRDKKEYKGPDKVIRALRYQNPTIEFDFKGTIAAVSGLTDKHPGTLVDSLANFAADIHGFANDNGIMVYEDPKREGGNEDAAKCSFKIIQYPFVPAPV